MKRELTLYIVEIDKTEYSELEKSHCINMVKQRFLPQIIMQSFGLHSEEYQIVKGDHGKPLIKSSKPGNFYFNISHTKNIWICATCEYELGVDIETCANSRKNVAEYYFTEQEKDFLAQSKDYNRTFFQIWTGKEAFAKMTGKGLSATLLRSYTITNDKVEQNNKTIAYLNRPTINSNTICTLATSKPIELVKIININSTTPL